MRRSLLAALVAGLVLVAGCGGDDDDDITTATTVADDADDQGDTGDVGGSDGSDADADEPSSSSTTEADTAEDPPAETGGPDEGLGDPLVYVADLAADAEVPGPGDGGATGRFEIEAATEDEVCIDAEVIGLDADVVAAHVHAGAAGEAGPPVIDIGVPTASDGETDTWTDVCVDADPDLLEQLRQEPLRFYANVHTGTYPDGAVRGQLEAATIFDRQL